MPKKIEKIDIEGMHCVGCEDILTKAIIAMPGVESVSVSYSSQTLVVVFHNLKLHRSDFERVIVENGYFLKKPQLIGGGLKRFKPFGLFLLLLVLIGGIAFWGKSLMPGVIQQIQPEMSYVLLLGIGFLTGFHCIGMCGGFVVSYTDPNQPKSLQFIRHLSYALGKTLSYTLLGAGFGLLGAAVAITPQIRGGLALVASLFLLIYGLKMLNVFLFLRRFTLRMPTKVNRSIAEKFRQSPRDPFRIGLLNGLLLGCGPLQAMYIMAAGSGDPFQGGIILLMFGLGTLFPLLGFGLFASFLSQSAMQQMVKVSGILVIAMSVMMAQRGLMMLKSAKMPTMTNQMK